MEPEQPGMIVHEEQPYNAGPDPAMLAKTFITPSTHVFVRSHGEPPVIDQETYRLRVGGLVAQPRVFSLADLAGFPRMTRAATLQCAGNRRDELLALAPIPGELPWGGEAVGTAVWGGVLLADVLRTVGVRPEAQHVAFTGLDTVTRDDEQFLFGGSIPLAKALDPAVLLADTMNGEPLALHHGAPLRVVVPGYIGARSVKWLGQITVQAEPSQNYFQAQAYRLARGGGELGEMLGELFVTALITEPAPGWTLSAGSQRIAGYTIGGGGACVARVEVSADSGETWRDAILHGERAPGVWQLWEAEVQLTPGVHELVARATDSLGRTMPATLAETWNPKGYMNNAWHRRCVSVV